MDLQLMAATFITATTCTIEHINTLSIPIYAWKLKLLPQHSITNNRAKKHIWVKRCALWNLAKQRNERIVFLSGGGASSVKITMESPT